MSDWQDERPPEEILSHSAARTKHVTPWEMLEDKGISTSEENINHPEKPNPWGACVGFFKKIAEKIEDRRLGVAERKRLTAGLGPSTRALQESLSYYSGLYQSRSPDPLRFKRLIKRNGIPDWSNPFPESVPEHYDVHPQGFLAADVDYLLQALEKDWPLPEENPPDPITSDPITSDPITSDPITSGGFSFNSLDESIGDLKSKEEFGEEHVLSHWPSLYRADVEHVQDRKEESSLWRTQARLCWALTLVGASDQQKYVLKAQSLNSVSLEEGDLLKGGVEKNPELTSPPLTKMSKSNYLKKGEVKKYSALAHLSSEVHRDNLWLITVDAYRHFPECYAGITRARLKEAAESQGFGFGLDLHWPATPSSSDSEVKTKKEVPSSFNP